MDSKPPRVKSKKKTTRIISGSFGQTCQAERGQSGVSGQDELSVPLLHRFIQERAHHLRWLFVLAEKEEGTQMRHRGPRLGPSRLF